MYIKKNYLNMAVLVLVLILNSCKKGEVNSENVSKNNDSSELLLIKKIMNQTTVDLKNKGIKKVLLDKDGVWFSYAGDLTFFKDGRIFYRSRLRKTGYFYWKVENDCLYINFNGIILQSNNYIQMVVETAQPDGYSSVEDLKTYKYSILIKTNENVGLFLANHRR